MSVQTSIVIYFVIFFILSVLRYRISFSRVAIIPVSAYKPTHPS